MEMKNRRLTDEEFDLVTRQLDLQVQQFESLGMPGVQEKVFDMLRTIDALHREGLTRLVTYLRENGLEEAVDGAAEDTAVHTLLVLYDLLPQDPLARVERALDTVRPSIQEHGGAVELLGVEDGVVHLSLSGACHGCAGSAITLRRGIEQALREGFAGFKAIEVHEPQSQPGETFEIGRSNGNGVIALDEIGIAGEPTPGPPSPAGRALNAPVFKTVARLEDLPPGAVRPVGLENKNALLVNLDGEVYAVGAECPGTEFPLTYGKLSGSQLTCPWHAEVFDVRSGKCLDSGGREADLRLPVYPVALVGEEIRIAVNVAPRPIVER